MVVITYNGAEFVGHAIESVLQQSWQKLELIIVDDGSMDGTPNVMRGSTTAAQVSEASESRAKRGAELGVRESAANSSIPRRDDWWLPDKLCRQVARAREEPGAGLVYSLALSVKGSGEEGGRSAPSTTAESSTGSSAGSASRAAPPPPWSAKRRSTGLGYSMSHSSMPKTGNIGSE